MREDICTIPISEVFEPMDGCPICRMRNILEKRMVEYIMGAAMMEPDVRIETNKKGFCDKHFSQMTKQRGRLQLALILSTHLNEFDVSSPSKLYNLASATQNSCFVCEKIEWGFERLISTTYRMYESELDFRKLFDSQPEFCLPHYKLLMDGCNKKNMKKYSSEFEKSLYKITLSNIKILNSDIKQFCSMFDYRSRDEGADFGNSRDAIERSIKFLTSREIEK